MQILRNLWQWDPTCKQLDRRCVSGTIPSSVARVFMQYRGAYLGCLNQVPAFSARRRLAIALGLAWSGAVSFGGSIPRSAGHPVKTHERSAERAARDDRELRCV